MYVLLGLWIPPEFETVLLLSCFRKSHTRPFGLLFAHHLETCSFISWLWHDSVSCLYQSLVLVNYDQESYSVWFQFSRICSDSICSQHLSCRMGNSNPGIHIESRIQLDAVVAHTVNPSTQKAQGKSLWAEASLATQLVPDQPGDLHPENKYIHT